MRHIGMIDKMRLTDGSEVDELWEYCPPWLQLCLTANLQPAVVIATIYHIEGQKEG